MDDDDKLPEFAPKMLPRLSFKCPVQLPNPTQKKTKKKS